MMTALDRESDPVATIRRVEHAVRCPLGHTFPMSTPEMAVMVAGEGDTHCAGGPGRGGCTLYYEAVEREVMPWRPMA